MSDTLIETDVTTNANVGSTTDVLSGDMPARAFFFAVVDEIGSDGILVRKVYATLDDQFLKAMQLPDSQALKEVFPEQFGISGRDINANATVAEHVMGVKNQTQFSSTSSVFPDGSPRFNGKTVYIDVKKAIQGGATLVSTEEIIAALEEYKKTAPKRVKRIEQIISYVRDIDKEVLLANKVPAKAVFTPDSYALVKQVGRVGRTVQVFGFALTAYDLTVATQESIKTGSMKPISAETIRQVGGWGSAVAGMKIGAVAGAAVGIETGPGAIVTGLVGGIIFGAAGYFGADWVADFIYEN
ncbi:hypothetical protein A1OO_21755 [Enterovibrio norvegicus FF-33]|uniref:hypothetical protein n=1 Tax=Enterovibrio norvegicus TaxID=188144 RepID=UPI0002F9064D|nr:hypothetical protein [Enterovibrio norvegicus]OEE64818.1 hypothetical protein A1OO_21755 [Enterovibrio norvegicus FF-33]OEE86852.1 hypothetical protein A1OQ_16375 [Enterovibrio norvegicus FF-162]